MSGTSVPRDPCEKGAGRVDWSRMDIQIISQPIPMSDLADMASPEFFDMVKAVVDVEKGVMVIGGELHSDEEMVLLDAGSEQRNLWGINLYPGREPEEFVEFDSMINVRPSHGNRSRGVDDAEVREKVAAVVRRLVR